MKNEVRKNVLVTGGAGFVGINLCRYLLLDKRIGKVTVLDNQNSSANNHEINTLRNLYPGRFEYIFHDIRDTFESTDKIDQIYNLACPASPPIYQRDFVYTHETCVIGTRNMILLALKHRARLLQASTSEVYGDPTVKVQSEDYKGNVNCVGIRSCYDEGKRFAETMCFDYGKQKGLDYQIARIFNTYGPYMNPEDGRVVSNFIMQALRNEDITIYGDGKQTRSFCYVDDLVAGLEKLMEHADSGQIVNLGNPVEFTVEGLGLAVIRLTESKSKFTHMPLPQDDPKQRKPDIKRAKQLLDWEPTTALERGLELTIPYFKRLV